jgi:hypothetical protein
MTSFPTHHFLPAHIEDFLDKDLITFCCEHQNIYHTLKFEMEREKKKTIMEQLHNFYKSENNTLALCYGVQEYPQFVSILFENLPTVFEFIQENKVTCLDFSMETAYGGYNDHIGHFYKGECIQTLLDELGSNTTLINLNLGLFGDLLDRDTLVEIMEDHLTLTYVILKEPPHFLYKAEDGSAVWSHFKP